MVQSNARLQTDMVFAAILWLTAMGLALWILVGLLESKNRHMEVIIYNLSQGY